MTFCSWGIYPVQIDGHEKIHSTIASDGYSDYKQSLITNIISASAFSVPPAHICACDSVSVGGGQCFLLQLVVLVCFFFWAVVFVLLGFFK